MDDEQIRRALDLVEQGLSAQGEGDLAAAIRLYRESLAVHPTAEAHTYLGWVYSMQGDLDAAIAECHRAIAVDPGFGNPYNDIGAYLIAREQWDEAIPWLEKAVAAPRYEPRHFPHLNLARVYLAKEMLSRALEEFQEVLAHVPGHEPARRAIAAIKLRLN